MTPATPRRAGGGTPTSGDQPPYRVLRSERPYRGKLFEVRVDELGDAEGRITAREVAEHGGAVGGLVVDRDGNVVLVEQWRQAVGRRMLEIVAGRYDVAGEAVEATLRRELLEELGLEGGSLTWLASFFTSPGWSDEAFDLYLVEGAGPARSSRPDPEWEETGLVTVALPLEQALDRALSGLADGKTLVALGLYGLLRAGLWRPDPQHAPAPDAAADRVAARSERTHAASTTA